MTDKQTDYYGGMFKAWVKQIGRKPTEGELATVHALGARPGKQALALGLALRETGVTGAQIVMACGAPQLNKMRDMQAKGYVKRVPHALDDAGHTVYRLELTKRGEAKVANAAKVAAEKPAAEAKPAKAKKAKAKPAPVDVGGVDVERAAMPVEAPAAEQQPQA